MFCDIYVWEKFYHNTHRLYGLSYASINTPWHKILDHIVHRGKLCFCCQHSCQYLFMLDVCSSQHLMTDWIGAELPAYLYFNSIRHCNIEILPTWYTCVAHKYQDIGFQTQKTIPSLPKKLQTDKGTEFLNRKLQQWLKAHKVHHFTRENEDIKASIVERFNRTLKSKLWRYFTRHDTLSYVDVLDSMVDVYNRTPHRSIGMAPNDVTSKNKARIWFRLYADPTSYKEPALRVGDSVRISKARRTFKKGYLAQWTEEIFTVVERKSTRPPTFVLADYSGEVLKGTFYPQELQKVIKTDDVYRVEKILKRTKNRVLVKWRGYPDKFNSWVNVKDLVWSFTSSFCCFSWVLSY